MYEIERDWLLASHNLQARDLGKSCSLILKAVNWQKTPFLREPESNFSRPSTDWMSPNHIIEGGLLYSVFSLKCQSNPPKTPSQKFLE